MFVLCLIRDLSLYLICLFFYATVPLKVYKNIQKKITALVLRHYLYVCMLGIVLLLMVKSKRLPLEISILCKETFAFVFIIYINRE